MTILQAIIFGAVQGLTEFLPVSSTAHLILLPWVAGWPDPGLSFDVALHLGTLLALLIYFRAEWIALLTSALGILRGRTQAPDAQTAMLIVAATIPGALAGALFEHQVENALRAPQLIAYRGGNYRPTKKRSHRSLMGGCHHGRNRSSICHRSRGVQIRRHD